MKTDGKLCMASSFGAKRYLLADADLLHEVLVVPVQPFVVHFLAGPVADGGHAEGKTFAGGLNEFPVADGHWLGEGSGHHARHARERARAEADRVRLDRDVGSEHEERL